MVEVDGGIDYRLRALEQAERVPRARRRGGRSGAGARVRARCATGPDEAPQLASRAAAPPPGGARAAPSGSTSPRSATARARSATTSSSPSASRCCCCPACRVMTADKGDRARRFTWLVDILYDHRVKLLPPRGAGRGCTAGPNSAGVPAHGQPARRDAAPTTTWRWRTSTGEAPARRLTPASRPSASATRRRSPCRSSRPTAPSRTRQGRLEPLRRDDPRRARPGRRRRPHQVLDDQLQGCAVAQRHRQDHAQVPDQRRHRHGRHGRVVGRHRASRRATRSSSTATTWASRTTAATASTCACPADWVVRRPESMTAFDAMTLGTAGFTAALAIMLMEHNGLKPAQRPGGRDRRHRRRGLGRGRDPGEARLPRRRDHGQGGGDRLPEGLGAKEVLPRAVDRPREDPAARQGDLGRRRRQPRRRPARVAAVDDEDRRRGRRRRASRRT